MTSTTRNSVYWLIDSSWSAGMSSERNSPGDRWLLNGKTLGSPTLSYTVKSWLWKDGSIDVRSAWEWSVKNICCFDSFGSQQQQQSSSDVFSFFLRMEIVVPIDGYDLFWSVRFPLLAHSTRSWLTHTCLHTRMCTANKEPVNENIRNVS